MNDQRPVVLLVDDEPGILSALRRALRREGWEIVTAESPSAALAVLEQRRVALVVSDQKMPGASGLDFLAEVARSHPQVVRVLLTGWPEEIPAARLGEIGIAALLPKPWDDAQLKEILRSQIAASATPA